MMPPTTRRLPAADPRCTPFRCPDCASQVWEVWSGAAPDLWLTVEVEHSPSCPAWQHDGREFAVELLPKSATAATAPTEETR